MPNYRWSDLPPLATVGLSLSCKRCNEFCSKASSWPSMLYGVKKSTSAANFTLIKIQKQSVRTLLRIYLCFFLSMCFLSVHNYILKSVCKYTWTTQNLDNTTAALSLWSNWANESWQMEITFYSEEVKNRIYIVPIDIPGTFLVRLAETWESRKTQRQADEPQSAGSYSNVISFC